MIEKIEVTASEDIVGERLDKYLKTTYPDISRTHIQNVLKNGSIKVNNKDVKSNYRIRNKDVIFGEFLKEVAPLIATPQDIPITIVYEDKYLIVIDKPKGLVVHPAPGHPDGTLVNALLHHFGNDGLSSLNGPVRPGIVHRLDKDTTGLMIAAKDDVTHAKLSTMLEKKEINRTYHALLWSNPGEEGIVDKPIRRDHVHRQKMGVFRDGKNALTHFKTLYTDDVFSLAELVLETGRTHQIRVHMASLGSAILGDAVYGGCTKSCRQVQPVSKGYAERILGFADRPMLHSTKLSFKHPRTRKIVTCEIPHPKDFEDLLQKIKDYK